MSHMQSVPGGVEQEALAEEKELAEDFRPEKGRKKIATGEGRLAFFLVTPTVLLLALIVGYPIVKAIIASFQKDPGLNAATGFFNKGGQFAGFDNYKTWLLNQCPTASGGTVKCPPGTLASEFWPAVGFTLGVTIVAVALETVLGMIMALMMHKAFKGRGIIRAAILIPWAIPTAVSAKLWQVIYAPGGVANKVFGEGITWSEKWPARIAIVLHRHLEDDAVHGPAHPGRAAGHSRRALRVREGRRGQRVAAVLADHAATGQAGPGRRVDLPVARHAAHVRPAGNPHRRGERHVDFVHPGR
jgi:hypothetical protein